MNFSHEEERQRLETAWHLFDKLLQQAASKTGQDGLPVKDPYDFAVHRLQTDITMSDQIPVWLKPSPGKTVTSLLRLKEAGPAEESSPSQPSCQTGRPGSPEAEGRQDRQAEDRFCSTRSRSGCSLAGVHGSQTGSQALFPCRQPEGQVRPTILVVYGTHCRLDNISQTGHWLEDEVFEYAGKTVVREKGQKASTLLMKNWRALRARKPELFADGQVLVWSQPCAVVDSVIYRWQLEQDRKEGRQAVNLVDMFSGVWTEESLEAASLLQRAQTGVAASCTGLTQVTDIGFASQAKAALARFHEDLKVKLRQKAKLEGVPCKYKTSNLEILQAARHMHSQMVSQNAKEDTVLRAMRQGGWFHFRPDEEGLLQPVDSQEWAASLEEGHAKLGDDHLRNRDSWVVEGLVQPFTEEDLASKEKGAALNLEASYLVDQLTGKQTGMYFDFRPTSQVLAQTERELRQVLVRQIEPAARRKLREADLADVTSQQRHVRRRHKHHRKKSQQALIETFRARQGGKTVKAALAAVVPKSGRTKKKQKPSLKLKPSVKQKLSSKEKPSLDRKSGHSRSVPSTCWGGCAC